MNPLVLIAFLVLGASASSYNSANSPSPVSISYGSHVVSSPSSYTRVSSPPSMYTHHTSSSSPSSYSQPSHQPSGYSHPAASTAYAPPSSSPSTSYYSSPSSSPTYSSSSPSSSYGYGSGESNAAITSFNRNINPTNSDTTSFTTSNGIRSSHNVQVVRGRPSSYQDEYGQTVQSDTSLSMSGHSYHQSPEGMHVSLTWNADENGFSAQGDHLPKPVQMPAEHAEAHRQALLTASQSPSSSYSNGGSNSPGGYGSSYPSSSTSTSSITSYGPPPQAPAAPASYPSYSAPPQQSAYRPVSQQQSSYGYY